MPEFIFMATDDHENPGMMYLRAYLKGRGDMVAEEHLPEQKVKNFAIQFVTAALRAK